ncbi:hypothetical protein J9B83_12535 [Marinomonas sp. A79]|uniref:ABC transporter substrate-binding protein n=1 Tax=Marinomonas vulgaris TaxID=2823372 RepID=A0ABS5HDN2_9GAMM|nr:hypothetical protein [Marinomonas vulgaris]MBR7889761.1 hypothetical protein [Marinomonas vulgaris]
MRLTLLVGLAMLGLSFTLNVVAASVVTVTPIADSMTRSLLSTTPVKVTYLPPTRLPINRIPSWLNKNRTEPLDPFDAIVNISALRPDLAFYTSVRSTNIRAVPIDIAEALLPGGERVAVQEPSEYFWLNPNNALMMLGILKRDLSLLWPEYEKDITIRYQVVSQSLRQIALTIDDTLLMSGYEGLQNANDSTEPFTKGLLLPTYTLEEITGTMPLNTLIVSTKNNKNQWLIDDFSRHKKTEFIDRWQQNLNNLISLQ